MSISILLVEDDPNLGLVLQEYLQLKGGYQVEGKLKLRDEIGIGYQIENNIFNI